MSELFQINKCADSNLLDLVHDEKPIVLTDVVIELQNKSYNDKVITETFKLRIPRTRGLLTSTDGVESRLNLYRFRLAFNKMMKSCHGTDSVILSELNDNQILRVGLHLAVVIKPKEVSNNVSVTGWCDRPELADRDTGCKICDNLCVNATLRGVVIGNADVPREKGEENDKD